MPDTKRTPTGALGGFLGLVGLSAVAGVLITATVTPAIAVSGAAASGAIEIFDEMPSILKIDAPMQRGTFWVGDQVLAQFYDQNRTPVGFDGITTVMYDAILSSEDPRYYQHGGVDLIGTTRALLSNTQGSGPVQGGSSISQQYVKNVLIQDCERNAVKTDTQSRDEVLQSCWNEATNAKGADGYKRKLQEMRYAIQLEKQYSKNDILLGYLNIANFGGTTYGVEAAANYYFNTSASQLTLGQAATLAGVVQNPNTYRIDQEEGSMPGNDGVRYNKAPDGSIDDVDPDSIAGLGTMLSAGKITEEQYLAAADGYSATKGRQLYVLSRLLADGKITEEQYEAAAVEPITPTITPTLQGCAASAAPYFCQYVQAVVLGDKAFGEERDDRARALRQDGLNIYTTLDWRVQDAAQAAMSEEAPTSVDGMHFGAATTSIEASTGRVLSITQNTKFSESAAIEADPNYSSLVYAGDSTFGRSDGFAAGSTFKLFTLIDWLEAGKSVRQVVNGSDTVIRRFPSTCEGGDYINTKWKPGNFSGGGGNGTPLSFTKASLNSGFVAMAAQLDLCSIGKVATRMGVTHANGEEIVTSVPNQVIGSDYVSPLAMAGAYATVANNGEYCEPKVVDRVTDAKGNDLPHMVPERGCEQRITPEVAATAAFALQGVMASGGTGQRGNPGDGTPLIGKTGTHQQWQTWMIESSTNVTTAAWAGNSVGEASLFGKRFHGTELSDIRYELAKRTQRAANEAYGGGAFPPPDLTLTREIQVPVPSVVGQNVDQAQETLRAAGFGVSVGAPVDSDLPADVIATQSARSAASGALITISPSNGEGATIPSVAGATLDQAVAALRGAGFTDVSGSCTADPAAPDAGIVSGTTPGAGAVANRETAIAVSYSRKSC